MIEPLASKRLVVGANLDLPDPHLPTTPWDVLLASCVVSLTGFLPTTVYTSDEYSVPWTHVSVEVKKYERYKGITGVEIRRFIRNGLLSKVEELVPPNVFKIITADIS
jgi:hypothetical protein